MKSNGKHKKRHLVKDGPTPDERKWARTIAAWRASGRSGKPFCQKRRINYFSKTPSCAAGLVNLGRAFVAPRRLEAISNSMDMKSTENLISFAP